MHVPDGFLDMPTSVATAAIAAGAVGFALRGARSEIAGSPARAGLTSCFIFAGQMINFPVAAGTSGHLIGAALATALVGPWTAILAMTCVVAVQALFFADGGLTALGTNVFLLAVIPTAVAAGVLTLVRRLAGTSRPAVLGGSIAAGFLSVPTAAAVFALLYTFGGAVAVPATTLFTAMVGTHLVIGVGEAAITGAVVGAVLATRPDLVHAASAVPARQLAVINDDGTTTWVDPDTPTDAPRPGRGFAAAALSASAIVAGMVSLLASSFPDGLEHVAEANGFSSAARDSAAAGFPLADYSIAGLGNLGTTVAGLLGITITLLVTIGIAAFAARIQRPAPATVDGP